MALNRALDEVHSRIAAARELTRVLDGLDDQPPPDARTVRTALAECRDVLSFFDTRAANSDAGGVRRDRRTDAPRAN